MSIDKLSVGDASVSSVSAARNLGTWLDSNGNLFCHMIRACKVSFYHLVNRNETFGL